MSSLDTTKGATGASKHAAATIVVYAQLFAMLLICYYRTLTRDAHS